MIYHMTEFLPYQLRKSLVLFFVGTFDFVKKNYFSFNFLFENGPNIFNEKRTYLVSKT